MDIHDLWQAGRSTTSRAWLTNPARNSLFIVGRPYLAEIARALSNLSAVAARQEDLNRVDAEISEALNNLSAVAARQEDLSRVDAEITEALNNLSAVAARQEDLNRVDATMRHHSEDVAASLRLSAAMKEELQRLSILIDGLHKNQLASAYRLGSLEDGMDKGRREAEKLDKELTEQMVQLGQLGALEQQVKALEQHIEALQAPAGMATLMPRQPLAIPATSLVLHSGPYGCFVLRQPDLISDHILAGSFWDSHLKSVIEQVGRPDGSAIDAGAYLGFHSAYMSRFFRAVHAFEPQVEIYRMLCANLLLNNCRNVAAVNGALYDIPGHLRLADNARQEIPLPVADGTVDYDRVGNAAALTFQLTDESDPKGVCTRTIDQLSLIDLAFIKVDTQGCDLHVLKGARATIQRCRPVITAEYERELAQGHGNTLEDYYHYFEEMAYDVQELDNRSDGKQVDLLATPR
jgi:FkbM family methyltransferase